MFTSEALRHLAAEVEVSQFVIGTDHPIPWQDQSIDHILLIRWNLGNSGFDSRVGHFLPPRLVAAILQPPGLQDR